jgi:hypothetical protein
MIHPYFGCPGEKAALTPSSSADVSNFRAIAGRWTGKRI